jgi:hypothetical protein
LPVTDIWHRPQGALFITVEGAGDSVLGRVANYTVTVQSDRDRLGFALERIPTKREGLSPNSFEVVSPALVHAPMGLKDVRSVRWDDRLGFIPHGGARDDGKGLPHGAMGVLACSDEGKQILEEVFGFAARADTHGSCAGYQTTAAQGHTAQPTTLYPGRDAAAARVLSEAIQLVVLSRFAAAQESQAASLWRTIPSTDHALDDGLVLARFYLTGLLLAREAYGKDSYEFRTCLAVVAEAIRVADATFAAAFDAGRSATVIYSSVYDALHGRDRDAHPAPLLGHDTAVWPISHHNVENLVPKRARGMAAADGPSSAADIGDYHVVLWTGVILAAAILGVVYFMLGMDDEKDPALLSQLAEPSTTTRR